MAMPEGEAPASPLTGLGTFEWNLPAGLIAADRRARVILGYGPGNNPLPASEVLNRIHPDDLPRVSACIRSCLDTLSRSDVDFRIASPGGSIRSVSVAIHPASGQAETLFGVIGDTSSANAGTLNGLPAAETLLAIFESLPIGVGVVDIGGRLLLSNQEMQRFWPTGILPSKDQARSHRWRGLHPDGSPIQPQDFPGARALRGERVVPGVEMLYTQDDGGEVWTRVTAVPVRDRDGKIVGQVAVVTDIDALQRSAQALHAGESRQAYLLKLADAIRPHRAPDAVKSDACEVLADYLGVDRALYAEVDGDDWVVEGGCARGGGDPLPSGRYPASTYGHRIMNIYRAGDVLLFRDARTDPAFSEDERAAHLAIRIVAAVGVPLLKDGTLVAILTVHSATPRNWTEEEIAIVRETAERTWAAVELARAEAAERVSEGKYRLLINSIDEGFCMIEVILDNAGRPVDYRFIETNHTFEQQTGLRDAVGRTARELVPDLESFWIEAYGRVALTGEPTRFTNSAEPLGRTFDVYAVRIGPAADLKVALLFRDITSQERAKSALVESESRFRHLADHAPVMVWVTEADGSCSYLSRSWYEFTGQTEDTGLGFGWLDAIHPDDSAETGRIFREANAGRQAFRLEYRLRRHDGEYRWAIDAAAPRTGPGGEFLGYVGSVLDITDRRRTEEALRDSEARFRVLTESLPQLVWTCLPDGSCDYLSTQWVQYTGQPEAEQLGLSWIDRVIHTDDRQRTLAHWLGAVAGRHPYDIEYRIRAADGTYRWFQTRGVPLRDAAGNIVKWFGTCTDIDDLKRAEEGLRKANRELEEFAYVASHDLQEPLRMVNIFSEMIVRKVGKDHPELRQYSRFVEQGVLRMESLLSDLLDYSRTVQRQELHTGTADLGVALDDALVILNDRVQGSGAVISREPLPLVRGDTAQLMHVFQNLLSNALKYRAEDRPLMIAIRASVDGEHHVISVDDNGIGFDQRYAERIFGLFRRLHANQYPGTGLGLAICKRIVERYGGRIWAEGRPGAGATFYFSLPSASEGE